MGMEERTDLARVIRLAKFNNFDFHELSLAIIELRIGWKSRDKGLRLRIGNSKYLPKFGVQEMSNIELV